MTKELGDGVRSIRQKAGLTQAEVAQMSGISEGMIAHIETGRRNPSGDSLDAILDALKVPAGERGDLHAVRTDARNGGLTHEQRLLAIEEEQLAQRALLESLVAELRGDQ